MKARDLQDRPATRTSPRSVDRSPHPAHHRRYAACKAHGISGRHATAGTQRWSARLASSPQTLPCMVAVSRHDLAV